MVEDWLRSMWHNSLHSLKSLTISFKDDKDNLVNREKGAVPRLVADIGIFSIIKSRYCIKTLASPMGGLLTEIIGNWHPNSG